jgi:hypothetical protein
MASGSFATELAEAGWLSVPRGEGDAIRVVQIQNSTGKHATQLPNPETQLRATVVSK